MASRDLFTFDERTARELVQGLRDAKREISSLKNRLATYGTRRHDAVWMPPGQFNYQEYFLTGSDEGSWSSTSIGVPNWAAGAATGANTGYFKAGDHTDTESESNVVADPTESTPSTNGNFTLTTTGLYLLSMYGSVQFSPNTGGATYADLLTYYGPGSPNPGATNNNTGPVTAHNHVLPTGYPTAPKAMLLMISDGPLLTLEWSRKHLGGSMTFLNSSYPADEQQAAWQQSTARRYPGYDNGGGITFIVPIFWQFVVRGTAGDRLALKATWSNCYSETPYWLISTRFQFLKATTNYTPWVNTFP